MKIFPRLWILTWLAWLFLVACQPINTPVSAPTLAPDCIGSGQIVHDAAPSKNSSQPIAMQVYLPPCYDSQTESAYPVLYLLHGSGHSESSWFKAGVDQIAEGHILSGNVPPCIIVTPRLIEDDRRAKFMIEDVIPYIDSHYRTLNDRQYRAISGASLGAILSTQAALQHPDMFANLACFGGAAVKSDKELLTGWINGIPEYQRPRILIDIGQQDPFLYTGQILMDILNAADYPYRYNSEEGGHTYTYWAGNFDEFVLEWIAEDWR